MASAVKKTGGLAGQETTKYAGTPLRSDSIPYSWRKFGIPVRNFPMQLLPSDLYAHVRAPWVGSDQTYESGTWSSPRPIHLSTASTCNHSHLLQDGDLRSC